MINQETQDEATWWARRQFLDDTTALEADFLAFLNIALDIAQRQPNQQHRDVIADYTASFGELIQVLLPLANASMAKKMTALPKVLGLFATHQPANDALLAIKHQIIGHDELERAFNVVGEKMDAVMQNYQKKVR